MNSDFCKPDIAAVCGHSKKVNVECFVFKNIECGINVEEFVVNNVILLVKYLINKALTLIYYLYLFIFDLCLYVRIKKLK